jgi:Arc/MetJ-type ribon-helix-helix transcriptional regulator
VALWRFLWISVGAEQVASFEELIDEHEIKVRVLQDALVVGEQSGTPRSFVNEAFLSRMHAKHDAEYVG